MEIFFNFFFFEFIKFVIEASTFKFTFKDCDDVILVFWMKLIPWNLEIKIFIKLLISSLQILFLLTSEVTFQIICARVYILETTLMQ